MVDGHEMVTTRLDQLEAEKKLLQALHEQARGLIGRLVDDDPITHSTEGLDDGCFWCGAEDIWAPGLMGGCWADHEWDCTWVEAMHLLGRDLGKHTVRSRPRAGR